MTATAAAWGESAPGCLDPKTSASARHARARGAFVVALSFGLLLLATNRSGAAASSTSASLQAQAASIATSLQSENISLTALGGRYLSEQQAVASGRTEAARLERQVDVVEANITADRLAAKKAAIAAYVNAGSNNELALFINASPAAISSGQEYLGIAEKQLSSTITTLGTDERALVIAQTQVQVNEGVVASALTQTSVDRARVLSEVAIDRAQLSDVKGQLAQLVAAEEAAQARAQAAEEANGPIGAGPPTISGISSLGTGPIPAGSIAAAFAGIRSCESGGNYALDTGNGYYGAYQFALGTWQHLGGAGLPSQAPAALQDAAAYKLYEESGFSSWPACAAILGLF